MPSRHDSFRHSAADPSSLMMSANGDAPPPIVTVNLGFVFVASGADGYVTAPFQGFDPAVTGQLTLAIGYSAAIAATTVAALAPLQHVVAATPVVQPTSVIDLAFATPGRSHAIWSENPSNTDVQISATTAGLSGILGPLTAAIAGTPLGKELAPIVTFGKGLLPLLDHNGGRPSGGSLTATPFFAANAGVGLDQSLTVLGQTTTSKQSGSLTINPVTGAATVQALGDTASLLGNAASLLADVQSGNLAGATSAGFATLASGTTVIGDLGTLLADAKQQQNPVLPAIKDPALNLNLQSQLGQSFGLGVGDPTQVTETLGVNVTADQFGAYALGKLLAQIAPQLIKDLSGQTPVQQPLMVLSQMAGSVATLAHDAASGFAGVTGATAVPSSVGQADISIHLTFSVTERQDIVLGSVANTQTFTANLEANAQGFYDLGTVAQPAITDLLVGLLETPGGREALQIGGDIVKQIDAKLGGHGAIGSRAESLMPVHWHS